MTEWTVDDLQHGDLIFCARPGDWVAFADSVADEPWRHVGALARDRDGDWSVLETYGDNFMRRKLVTFLEAYETFGVARLGLDAACIAAATAWMFEMVESETPHVYAWDDLILSGLFAACHRHLEADQRVQLRSALASAARAAKERPEHRAVASLTCSAFVQVSYDIAGSECRIYHERWRNSWPPQTSTIDELFDGPAEQFNQATRNGRSLMEIFEQEENIERSAAGSQAKPGQIREMLKVLRAAVGGWTAPDDASIVIGSDGRWITPGDLWRSPTVVRLGRLGRAEALVELGLAT